MNDAYLSAKLASPIFKYLLAALFVTVVFLLFLLKGAMILYIVLAIPAMALFLFILFQKPKFGIYSSLFISFLIPTFSKFVYDLPYGLAIETILVLTYIVLFFKHFKEINFTPAKNIVVLLMSIWMAYIVLQLANPEAKSAMAWAYAMRGIAFFQLLLIPLVFILLNTKRDLTQFVVFYFALSIIGFLWAAKQHQLGLTTAESQYLYNSGAAKTHILFGKLRVFSIYFEAGTFGAAAGQVCIISALLYLGPFKRFYKYSFLLIAIFAFYGMMISGTRGALAIPAVGTIVYVILIKNIKYIVVGLTILAFGFVFLKFTTIGQSNYDIRRLRSALDPKDASLNVRLENREKLSEYLKGKPFGGGVGTVGFVGQEFSPNTWLANFPPDGLYTRIRAETGIVGYYLYLFIWFFILYRGFRVCWNLKKPTYKSLATAFLASYAGVLVANYGNSVMTQYPINYATFITLAFIFIIKKWDNQALHQAKDSSMKKKLLSGTY
ncbi:O-antigen ligase family protein [Xanthomarina gelatinilytica]|uniref:O-antigen ligase family protein n=1 Tax=Xanthomarina gelatinilytica TaxID=1137281 RepID=UPI003AA9D396